MWHCGTGAEGFCHTHRSKGYGGGRAPARMPTIRGMS